MWRMSLAASSYRKTVKPRSRSTPIFSSAPSGLRRKWLVTLRTPFARIAYSMYRTSRSPSSPRQALFHCSPLIARHWASNRAAPKSSMSPEASRMSDSGVGRRAFRRPSSKVKWVLNFCASIRMPTLSGKQMISIVSTPWLVAARWMRLKSFSPIPRMRGRCRRGRRLRAAVPHGHYKTVTLVAGLRLCGLVAQKAFDRPINAASFEEWVEKCLVPTLSKGDIVVMENLSSHKGPRVEQLIKAAGAELRYLPPYSPDMNPIEKAYSKLKAFLRKIAERTVAGLLIALDACADIFKPAECVNYFEACGYDTG